jgi:hypothetical protein
MIITVTVEFRDDKKKTYKCVDAPAIGQFVTLYLPNLERTMIPAEAIKEINVKTK